MFKVLPGRDMEAQDVTSRSNRVADTLITTIIIQLPNLKKLITIIRSFGAAESASWPEHRAILVQLASELGHLVLRDLK